MEIALEIGQAGVSAFGGNLDNDTAPAVDKWNGFASSMGSCLRAETESTYEDFADN